MVLCGSREVEETAEYIAKINKALGDADEAQARELAEERDGVLVSCNLARQNAAATKRVMAGADGGGDALLMDVLAMLSRT